jgi:hypothetical protein
MFILLPFSESVVHPVHYRSLSVQDMYTREKEGKASDSGGQGSKIASIVSLRHDERW